MIFNASRVAVLAAAFIGTTTLAHAQDPAAPDASTPVATVNGITITLGDMIAVRGELPEQVQGLPDAVLYDGIRRQMIDSKLAEQAAISDGVADQPAVAAALARQRSAMLADFYLRGVVAAEVTPEAVRARYDSEIASAQPEREIRASHILVPTQEAAQALRDQLDDGADFAELAGEHGTDGTSTQGGDLGYFTRERMVAPFAEAAFALEVGETAGPVETQFGWHLIRVTDARDVAPPSFEEVAAQLEQAMSQEVAQAALESLREGATITIDESQPGLDALRNDGLIE